MEDGGGGQVTGKEAAGVRKDGTGVDHVQAEEGNRPHTMEDLEEKNKRKISLKTFSFPRRKSNNRTAKHREECFKRILSISFLVLESAYTYVPSYRYTSTSTSRPNFPRHFELVFKSLRYLNRKVSN